MFYRIIWCPSIPLCVYNFRLFSFHYYVTNFVLTKAECKSVYYHFRRDHERTSFRKLARNKWMSRNLWFFLWSEWYLLLLIFKLIQKWKINFGSQFRNIFRTLSNIQNRGFCKNNERLLIFDNSSILDV